MVLRRRGCALPFDLRKTRLGLRRVRVPDLLLHVDHVPDHFRAGHLRPRPICQEGVVIHRHGDHGRSDFAESDGRRR